MKAWRVYFEFYGKQMVTEVDAHSENEAKKLVKQRLNFIKTVELPPATEPWTDNTISDFFGGFKRRK